MLVKIKNKNYVFLILLVFFFFINGLKGVSAEAQCCFETSNQDYCIGGNELPDNCEDSALGLCSGYPQRCGIGTCVPFDGSSCLTDYVAQQCVGVGTFYPYGENPEPTECKIGCCSDENICGIVEQVQCSVPVDDSIISQADCSITCLPTELVCCYDGLSQYWTSKHEDCTSPNTAYFDSCGNVDPSVNPDQDYYHCGKDDLLSDSSIDVYKYDLNGNIYFAEGPVGESNGILLDPFDTNPDSGDCDFPNYRCSDPDAREGGENAYCKSTACVEEGDPMFASYIPSSFLMGDTLCLDVLKGHYMNDMRSKYLKPSVVGCVNGELKSVYEFNELDRGDVICKDNFDIKNAILVDNKWEECLSCGDGGGDIWDVGAYLPIIGGVLVPLGNYCDGKDVWANAYWGGTICEDLGKGEGIEMCEYDADFWAPMGSCNPIHPPSVTEEELAGQCHKCGKEVDGNANLCTEQECNALGDCQFFREGMPSMESFGAVGGLAIGTAVANQILCKIWGSPFGICEDVALTASWYGVKNIALAGANPFFWGVWSLVVGAVAGESALNERDRIEKYDLVESGDNFAFSTGNKLVYELVAARSFEQVLKESFYAATGEYCDWCWWEVGELVNMMIQWQIGPTVESEARVLATSKLQGMLTSETGVTMTADVAEKWASFTFKSLNWAGVVYHVYNAAEAFQAGTCEPESIYPANTRCGLCGASEGQWYCTKERCGILGGGDDPIGDPLHCKWVSSEEGGDYGTCFDITSTDTTYPEIENIKLTIYDLDNNFVEEHTDSGNTLEVASQINWNDAHTVAINLDTSDDPSRCIANLESGVVFDYLGGSGYRFDDFGFETTHHLEFNLTVEQKQLGEIILYIKCEDLAGNYPSAEYDRDYIKLTVGDAPDSEPPLFMQISPYNSFAAPEGTTGVDIDLIVLDNKGVAECRYSKTEINFVDMGGTFSGGSYVQCPLTQSTSCQKFSTELDLNSGEIFDSESGVSYYTYSIGCIDLSGYDLVINYSVAIYPTFSLDFESPQEGGLTYDVTPEIKFTTSEPTQCSYNLTSNDYSYEGDINEMVDGTIYSHEHLEELQGSHNGIFYNLELICHDLAYNIQTSSSNFYVLSDPYPPSLTMIWTSGQKVYLRLDEEATCKYSNENSNFNYDDEDVYDMYPSSLSEEKSANLGSDVYYIKCRDRWENEGSFVVYP